MSPVCQQSLVCSSRTERKIAFLFPYSYSFLSCLPQQQQLLSCVFFMKTYCLYVLCDSFSEVCSTSIESGRVLTASQCMKVKSKASFQTIQGLSLSVSISFSISQSLSVSKSQYLRVTVSQYLEVSISQSP